MRPQSWLFRNLGAVDLSVLYLCRVLFELSKVKSAPRAMVIEFLVLIILSLVVVLVLLVC